MGFWNLKRIGRDFGLTAHGTKLVLRDNGLYADDFKTPSELAFKGGFVQEKIYSAEMSFSGEETIGYRWDIDLVRPFFKKPKAIDLFKASFSNRHSVPDRFGDVYVLFIKDLKIEPIFKYIYPQNNREKQLYNQASERFLAKHYLSDAILDEISVYCYNNLEFYAELIWMTHVDELESFRASKEKMFQSVLAIYKKEKPRKAKYFEEAYNYIFIWMRKQLKKTR